MKIWNLTDKDNLGVFDFREWIFESGFLRVDFWKVDFLAHYGLIKFAELPVEGRIWGTLIYIYVFTYVDQKFRYGFLCVIFPPQRDYENYNELGQFIKEKS